MKFPFWEHTWKQCVLLALPCSSWSLEPGEGMPGSAANLGTARTAPDHVQNTLFLASITWIELENWSSPSSLVLGLFTNPGAILPLPSWHRPSGQRQPRQQKDLLLSWHSSSRFLSGINRAEEDAAGTAWGGTAPQSPWAARSQQAGLVGTDAAWG